MFCIKCGAQIKEGAVFCTNCGAPVRKKPVQVQNVEPEPEAQPAPAPVYQETVQVQNMTPMQGPAPVQPQNMGTEQGQVPVQKPGPRKRKLGLILGLSIGIPMFLIIVLAIVGIFVIIPKLKEAAERFERENTAPYGELHDPENANSASGRDDGGNSSDTGNGADQGEGTGTDTGSGAGSGTASGGGIDTDNTAGSGEIATRTLMIYMVGSDLETETEQTYGGAATDDIYEMCEAIIPDGVNIILECGGSEDWVHPGVPDGEVTRFKIENGELLMLEKLGRTTMTCEGNLSDFITFASDNYPAENYTLILWDHGGGIPVGFGCDLLGDYYDSMCDYEIREELREAGIRFDSVIFDACNMCTLEMARALDGYADYMVGAESYVNGTGIYYTRWMSGLNGDPRAFCEKIVQDYMDENEEEGLIGSMSVIRLDYIPGVYEAYTDYMAEACDALTYGDYSTYYQARGNCGYYESNDSVDLITLATSYNNDYSTPLINAVVNAVVYTESDFAYGHGLMAYSPYDAYYMYEDGRKSFVELGYDSNIVDFYDGFMSRKLAYLGEEYVADYGGSWFDGDYSEEVEAAGGIAAEYDLPVVDCDQYYAAELSDELWENAYYISQGLLVELENDGGYLILGEDYNYTLDSEDRLALVDPQSWTYLNGNIAAYYCVDYYDDYNGTWAQTGYIPVTVNGYGAFLYVYYDNEIPYGTIQGYSFYDYETETEYDEIYTLDADDEIDLLYQYLNIDGSYYYDTIGEPFRAGDCELDFAEIDLEEYNTLGWYAVYDVYGNSYTTEMVYLGSNSAFK